MKQFLLSLLIPVILLGQTIEPPLDFSHQPKPEIPQEIRDRWMDGPQALEREAKRNQVIFSQHQFPLGLFLFIVVLILLIWWGLSQREMILSKIKRTLYPPPTPAEKAQKRLQDLEKVTNLKERYRLLGLTIRESLEERYDIPALASTKEEVLDDLKESREDYKEVFDAVESVDFQNKTPSEKHFQDLKKRMSQLLK